MLITNAEVDGVVCDVTLKGDRIATIEPANGKQAGDIDGEGGALIPGLHDHHIHLNASAAALSSVRCGPPDVMTPKALIDVLNQPGQGWLRGTGYHHSVAGEIDRDWLDQNGPDRPVRIQHRSGRMWIVNSAGLEALALRTSGNGRLVDSDALMRRGAAFPDLTPIVTKLLSYGITGVTEVTPSNGCAEARQYLAHATPLKLCIMGKAELSLMANPLIGPLKLHYHDHDLPALDALAQEIKRAHESGRAVAAHCVTRAELMLTLAAIEDAGTLRGDRVEHAAIADEAAIEWMARLGLIVVTQPNFIVERATAYVKDVPEVDHRNLWRLRTFAKAGLSMAAGSDAPFGDLNPWAAMQAAIKRPAGFGFGEAISPTAALELYTKPAEDAGGMPRRVAAGQMADLCLLDRNWAAACKKMDDATVKTTLIDGRIVYSA